MTSEMAWWIKCLLCKREDLSSDPQHSLKKSGRTAHLCNPRDGELGEQGISGLAANQSSQFS